MSSFLQARGARGMVPSGTRRWVYFTYSSYTHTWTQSEPLPHGHQGRCMLYRQWASQSLDEPNTKQSWAVPAYYTSWFSPLSGRRNRLAFSIFCYFGTMRIRAVCNRGGSTDVSLDDNVCCIPKLRHLVRWRYYPVDVTTFPCATWHL